MMKPTIVLLSCCQAACVNVRLSPFTRRAVLISPAALFVGSEAAQARRHELSAEGGAWSPYRDFMVGPEKNAISDFEVVPSQVVQPGLLDVNNALVTDFKKLPGMYPHAAGLIASNGPYRSLDDLMHLHGANDHDKELFRKYRKQLTVLPPGRMFNERINARQST